LAKPVYIFTTIEEVQGAAAVWLWTYNNERPNMAIGVITPKQKSCGGLTHRSLIVSTNEGPKRGVLPLDAVADVDRRVEVRHRL